MDCISHKGSNKKHYNSLSEARQVILEMYEDPKYIASNLVAYECRSCNNVHIGNRKKYKAKERYARKTRLL